MKIMNFRKKKKLLTYSGWGGGGGWGWGQRVPPTSFYLVTSTNVGFSPKNFLTFSFNPFSTLV